jgi:hypothetical protein
VQTGKKDLFGLAMPDGTEVEVFSGQQIFGMQTPEQVTNLSGSGIGDIRGAAPGYSVNTLRDETTAEDITDLYIGLIGRAPDVGGLDFWAGSRP